MNIHVKISKQHPVYSHCVYCLTIHLHIYSEQYLHEYSAGLQRAVTCSEALTRPETGTAHLDDVAATVHCENTIPHGGLDFTHSQPFSLFHTATVPAPQYSDYLTCPRPQQQFIASRNILTLKAAHISAPVMHSSQRSDHVHAVLPRSRQRCC
jgi:hypothetical protein